MNSTVSHWIFKRDTVHSETCLKQDRFVSFYHKNSILKSFVRSMRYHILIMTFNFNRRETKWPYFELSILVVVHEVPGCDFFLSWRMSNIHFKEDVSYLHYNPIWPTQNSKNCKKYLFWNYFKSLSHSLIWDILTV